MIKLIVDNKTELDIIDRSVSIFKEILDKDSIAKRSASWTREIELPNTPINNKYFETIYLLDRVTLSFKKGKRVKAIITDGANILLDGYMQLINTKRVLDKVVYSVIFAGQLIDLMKSVEDFNINNLDFSEYNHIRNWDNIRKSWTFDIMKNGSYIKSKEGYVYPDIKYTDNGLGSDLLFYDYFPAVNVKTIVDKLFQLSNSKYNSDFFNSDYFKSLYIPFSRDKLTESEEKVKEKTVIRSFDPLQKKNGQTVYSGNWVPMTTKLYPNTSTAGAYWNTDMNNAYNLNVQGKDILNDKIGKIGPIDNEILLTDTNNKIAKDIYVCQQQGEYKIDIQIPLVIRYNYEAPMSDDFTIKFKDEGELEYRWIVYLKRNNGQTTILKRNRQPIQGNSMGLEHIQPSDSYERGKTDMPWYDNGLMQSISVDTIQFLNPGDKIYIELHFKHLNTVWEISNPDNPESRQFISAQIVTRRNVGQQWLKYEVKPTSNQGFGFEEIELNRTLPEINGKDFLMSIIQLFNLVVDVDPSSTIEEPIFNIIPYQEYFKTGRIINDWILDQNSELKQIYNDDTKMYSLSYKKDGDYFNKEYLENVNKVYGEFNLYTTDELAEKEDKLDLIFAPTINAPLNSDRVIPYLCEIDDNEQIKRLKTVPRILFYNGLVNCNEYKVYQNPSTVLSTEYEYPYMGMWDHPFNPKYTLEFNYSDRKYYDSSTVPQFNLFNQFYQNLKGRVSEEFRTVEGEFYLTPTQFANHRFNDLIKIENQLYKVLVIDNYTYDEEESLTKVILEKYLPNNEIYFTPLAKTHSSCPIDVRYKRVGNRVLIVSNSGTINEDCCNERGGIWDPNTNTCSIKSFDKAPTYDLAGPIINPPKPGISIKNPVSDDLFIPTPTPIITDGGKDESIRPIKLDRVFILDGTIDNILNPFSVNPSKIILNAEYIPDKYIQYRTK